MEIFSRFASIVVLALMSMCCDADELQPFTSDGCSVFPDGTREHNKLWLACCERHDYDYWKGGTYQQRVDSDQALKQCVSNIGQPKIALIMLAGVRVGGSPLLPTSFRWGYGWPYPRYYGALTKDELKKIQELTSG